MNIIQIFNKFLTQEACITHLERIRWGNKPICPHCKSDNTYSLKENGRRTTRHHCNGCRKSFSVLVGTIFEDTRLPLQKWFLCISLIINAKNGISARQLARDLEINKDTAWRMAMKIREAMNIDRIMLSGIIEMDETYVGGKPRKETKKDDDDKNKRGRGTKKEAVVGMVERDGNVKAFHVKKNALKGKNLLELVRDNIDGEQSTLITDEYPAYNIMSKYIEHYTINHKISYAIGDINTNSIESFWALLKRGIIGQFHKVSVKHLNKYIDEFCFRYNHRKLKSDKVFDSIILNMIG